MYTTDLQTIGKRLADHRNSLGWTQAQVADAADILEHNYSLIESGKAEMKLLTLVQICNGLKLPVEELLLDDALIPDYKTELHELIEKCSQTELKQISHLIQYALHLHK